MSAAAAEARDQDAEVDRQQGHQHGGHVARDDPGEFVGELPLADLLLEVVAGQPEAVPEVGERAEVRVLRQASAGLVWSKQIYPYDVGRWLDGDPGQPPPDGSRRGVRNDAWRHLDSFDVLAMPDPWEYPWFAAWDMAFHTVALAHLDPALDRKSVV